MRGKKQSLTLKQALDRVNMNPRELARRLGVDPSAVSRWMSGTRRPSSRHLVLIADALRLTVDEAVDAAGVRS